MYGTSSNCYLSDSDSGNPIRSLSSQVSVQPRDTTAVLYQQLSKASGYSVHRLRLTLARDGSLIVPNSHEVTIAGAGLENRADLFVKDLG